MDNFEIAFDVWSIGNNCATADLIRRGNTRARGVYMRYQKTTLTAHFARMAEEP